MKDFFKFFSLNGILLGLLLSGCGQAPKEVDGQSVQILDVYLVHPLEINTDKEQQFYFRFKRQPKPDTNYLISVITMISFEEQKFSDIHEQILAESNFNKKLIDEKMLSYEISLIHYDKNGKPTPIDLSSRYINYKKLANGNIVSRFSSDEANFEAFSHANGGGKATNGETYHGDINGLARFIVQDKGGYYRLSLRALQQYPNYPKMKLAIEISPDVTK